MFETQLRLTGREIFYTRPRSGRPTRLSPERGTAHVRARGMLACHKRYTRQAMDNCTPLRERLQHTRENTGMFSFVVIVLLALLGTVYAFCPVSRFAITQTCAYMLACMLVCARRALILVCVPTTDEVSRILNSLNKMSSWCRDIS
jgi:magnesium-transporting ATPase (P-type)